jgi:FAD synthetase
MTKVMCFGTFDILHPGHLYLFSEAKKLGDELVVVVGRDSTVRKVKGREPMHGERERLANVAKQEMVGRAVLGDPEDFYSVIEQEKPDVLCLGYDQKSFISESLQDELLKRGLGKIRIVHIGPYKENVYKSSKLRERKE